ncbi:MAG: hypothetical protein IT158_23215 [Bryobacterales bacterium]|nr:hypothetical protein [Bryobacterales bacterium]
MSGPGSLTALEARFRRAVAAGRFEEARGLLEMLVRGVPECAPALENALRLLEWARRGVLAGRAQRARQMAELAGRPVYRPGGSPPARHTWKVQG